jgi:uncharacterized protein YdeI (YjbR/CyaY-like superfamily)
MSWAESVDEALCFGWTDGFRNGIDDVSYSIRFTSWRTSPFWSVVNIARFAKLQKDGRMTAAGELAFYRRK